MLEHAERQARASVDLSPRYRTPASFDYVQGRCIDLSEGGMFIASQLPCESGTLLKFECAVGDVEAAVKGVARVVWRRSGDGERPSGMGLKFVKLEPGSPEAIQKLLTHAREQGRTAPSSPLSAQVRVTESYPALAAVSAEVAAEPVAARAAEPAPAASAAPRVPEPAPVSPQASAVAPKHVAQPKLPVPEPAFGAPAKVHPESSSLPVWIALAIGAALLAWLLLR